MVALRENTPEIIGKSRSRSARVRTCLLGVLIFFLCSSTYPGGHKPYLKIRQASQVKCGPIFWLRQEPAKLIPTELGSVQQQYFYTFDVLSCLILFNFQFHACNSKLKVSKLLPAPAFVLQKNTINKTRTNKISRNEILLKHSHAHQFMIIYTCFCATIAELSR